MQGLFLFSYNGFIDSEKETVSHTQQPGVGVSWTSVHKTPGKGRRKSVDEMCAKQADSYQLRWKARLEKFSLALHPDKTRLIVFGRFAAEQRARAGLGKPETFDFLGFTFIRKSRRDRAKAKLREIKDTLRRKMHLPIPEQGRWLGQVVTGYFAYHAVPSNLGALVAFHHHVTELWRRTLQRRSQKDRTRWSDLAKLVTQWLPEPRIQHPWPNQRFAVKYPRWKPYAGKPHVRLCAGGA
jgi:RNA-directed DNA polymerase